MLESNCHLILKCLLETKVKRGQEHLPSKGQTEKTAHPGKPGQRGGPYPGVTANTSNEGVKDGVGVMPV